ncbi:unnamed protein product [Gongylonema pulchrum]|uniref:SSD domain-containing protein n=1 Tax=Gongylonema pulchrum TaxID=637853 RepID=A0A183DAZ8_9BILA|nr:unnamed protein product [Gongylonema pulchrum]
MNVSFYSSLTNALSFGIGVLSSTPAVRTFSIYSCFAIIVCYLFQLILFTAVLALSGRREQANYQSLLCCWKANPDVCPSSFHFSFLRFNYLTWIFLITVMAAYYYVSWLGIQKLEAKISIDKMALPDSYLHDFQHIFEDALRNMQPITVFVLKPGDLRDSERLNGNLLELFLVSFDKTIVKTNRLSLRNL